MTRSVAQSEGQRPMHGSNGALKHAYNGDYQHLCPSRQISKPLMYGTEQTEAKKVEFNFSTRNRAQ
jgi:hypothetical protein